MDTSGKELTADLDYIAYDGHQSQMLIEKQKADTLYGKLPQNIKIYSGKADYIHPLKKDARFEAGVKSSYVKTTNNGFYDNAVDGAIVRDLGRSNDFYYEENISAAYVNLSGPLTKKISAQLGLRLENTISKGRSMGFEFKKQRECFCSIRFNIRKKLYTTVPDCLLSIQGE